MLRLALALLASTEALQPCVHPEALRRMRVGRRLPSHVPRMGRCDGEGFNSFRQWPSSSAVSLTGKAQSVFGLGGETSFAEMRKLSKCDTGELEAIMDARPMEDQRGEKVLLDVNAQGRLEWITVV